MGNHNHYHHDHDLDFSFHDDEDSELPDSDGGMEGESNAWLLDNVELITVGVDVGSSTTHLIFSRLHLQRLAQSLSSRFVVVERSEIYRSPILLTPFTSESTINVSLLSEFIDDSYRNAGISPGDVDTGVVILTGVALERKNSRAVAELFASHGGKFVCASAGHNLEGILSAFGSGAVALSRKLHGEILHIDIGGGTSKLALIRDGEVLETAAISVGARLLAFDANGAPSRIESAAFAIAASCELELDSNTSLPNEAKEHFAKRLAQALMAAVDQDNDRLTNELMLTPKLSRPPVADAIFTFSGGVSEYLFGRETMVFNDLAQYLSNAIKEEFGKRSLTITSPSEGIRATAIGASQFTVQLSGNTIFISTDVRLPMHNLPVICPKIPILPTRDSVAAGISTALARLDLEEIQSPICIYLPWQGDAEYTVLLALAGGVSDALGSEYLRKNLPLVIALEIDLGAALGRILQEELNFKAPLISIDGVELRELDFVDIGEPLQPTNVIPVMVKSLAFPAAEL